jgi:sulfide dehydrogenase cytochrome subunit
MCNTIGISCNIQKYRVKRIIKVLIPLWRHMKSEADMQKLRLFYCIIAAAVLVPFAAFAASDVSEGERLGKPCAGCHATNGYAPGEYIARIGGQNAEYMTNVMKEFATGKRPGSVEMGIVAKGYSEADIAAISEYYAAKKWKNSTNKIDPKQSAAGLKLTKDNGCFDCHGAKGEGIDAFPRIGGQNAGYLNEALKRYKAGKITSEEMALVKDMSESQLEALAQYFSGIRK